MILTRVPTARRSSTALALLLLAGGLIAHGASRQVIQQEVISLELRPLTASLAGASAQGPRPHVIVDPKKGGEVVFSVRWPADEPSEVTIKATEAGRRGETRRISLVAQIALPDGTTVRSERTLDINEGATALFELFRLDNRPLTLAVEGQVITRPVLADLPHAGRPVRFQVQIHRVDRGVAVALESNDLSTFLGSPVRYQFSLGSDDRAPAAELLLTPIRIDGDLVEVEVGLSGSLPGEVTEWVSRSETWMTSRGAQQTIGLESGEPPSGYRFLVATTF